jgi:hypothetical protein
MIELAKIMTPPEHIKDIICETNNIDIINYYENNGIKLKFNYRKTLKLVCRTGFAELLDKINIRKFDFECIKNLALLNEATDNKHYKVATKLLKYGTNLSSNLHQLTTTQLYIAIANYDYTQLNLSYNPINVLLYTAFNTCSEEYLVNFYQENAKIVEAYLDNKLWTPQKHYLFSTNKNNITLTFMLIIKKMNIKIPKPIIYILINLFIFN